MWFGCWLHNFIQFTAFAQFELLLLWSCCNLVFVSRCLRSTFAATDLEYACFAVRFECVFGALAMHIC